jgi:methyl-accepting chemotaxis protein
VLLDVSTSNIRRRVAWIGVVLIASPVLILSLAAWFVLHRIGETPIVVSASRAKADLTHLTQNLVDVCRSYHQQTISKLESGRTILEAAGQIRLDPDRYLVWRAKNEATGEVKNLQLPLMVAGTVQFEPVKAFADAAPVVDEIEKTAGTPATVFQRINELGDMLRVSSSVKSKNGERAIGSFIPAVVDNNAKTEPLRSVLAGEPYVAKSLLDKTTYWTAYEPIKDRTGGVVGMLTTALPEDEIATQVRNVAVKSMPSDHNDFFAFEASGEQRGTAQIMADQSLEGRDLWGEKDSSGRVYVQELCKRALSLGAGEVAEYKYQKTARPGGLPQMMSAHFGYVKELDWVVGFAQPEGDLLAGVSPLQALTTWALWLLLGVGAASTGLAVRVWMQVSDDMADKLAVILSHLTKDAKQISTTALALLDETERTLAANLENSGSKALALSVAVEDAKRMAAEIHLAINYIDSTNRSIGSMTGALDQITFATNLLMVNATIESSQTGTGAESLSGVATELRFLAELSRKAARETEQALQESRVELEKGSEEVLQLMKDLSPDQGPVEQQNKDKVADLQRQARQLILLAQAIDQTVQSINEDRGLRV